MGRTGQQKGRGTEARGRGGKGTRREGTGHEATVPSALNHGDRSLWSRPWRPFDSAVFDRAGALTRPRSRLVVQRLTAAACAGACSE